MRKTVSLRIAVDIGGTFTDGIAHASPGNRIWVAKQLTTTDDPGTAVSQVVDELLAAVQVEHAGFDVTEVVHGTTLVANTIIERNGALTGLLVTEGTSDVLDIAREFRYDLYDLELELPTPLVPPRLREEVIERLDASGAVVTPLSEKSQAVLRLERHRVESVAVCLLHAYGNAVHERRIERYLKNRLPGIAVSLSSAVAGEMNIGSLATVASINPANLSIICVDNGHYGETGYQRGHTSGVTDIAQMAAGAGITQVRTIVNEAQLGDGHRLIRDGNGTSFVLLEVDTGNPPAFKRDFAPGARRLKFRSNLGL